MIDKKKKTQPDGNVAAWLENTIKEFCRNSPENSMKNEENERAFDEPLVGFSNGADPLYEELKKDIGSPFMTPVEIFREAFPDSPASADELTVISFILPQTKATKADNRKGDFLPIREMDPRQALRGSIRRQSFFSRGRSPETCRT